MPQADLDDIFKKKLSDFQAAPSSGLWEKINDELPPPTPLYKRGTFQALSLVCLISFGLGLGYFINNYSVSIVAKSEQANELVETRVEASFLERARAGFGQFTAQLKTAKNSDQTLALSSSEKNLPVAHASNTNKIKGSNFSKTNNAPRLGAIATSTAYASLYEVPASQEPNKTQSFDSDLIVAIATNNISENDLFTNANTSLSRLQALGLESSDSRPLPSPSFPTYRPLAKTKKGLHIGGFAGYSNTWIISKTLDSKQFEELEYSLDFGENYGIALGYNFNDKWDVQLEWVINSKFEQNYTYELEGRMYDTEVQLNYYQLPVLLKYRVARKNNALSYLVGARFARLKSASLDLESPSVRIVDFLNTKEIGLITGLEYELHMDRRYYLTLGMRGSVGRAFNEWSDIKDSNKPFNVALGLRAGFHYNFVK